MALKTDISTDEIRAIATAVVEEKLTPIQDGIEQLSKKFDELALSIKSKPSRKIVEEVADAKVNAALSRLDSLEQTIRCELEGAKPQHLAARAMDVNGNTGIVQFHIPQG